jgi:hypothetical protein
LSEILALEVLFSFFVPELLVVVLVVFDEGDLGTAALGIVDLGVAVLGIVDLGVVDLGVVDFVVVLAVAAFGVAPLNVIPLGVVTFDAVDFDVVVAMFFLLEVVILLSFAGFLVSVFDFVNPVAAGATTPLGNSFPREGPPTLPTLPPLVPVLVEIFFVPDEDEEVAPEPLALPFLVLDVISLLFPSPSFNFNRGFLLGGGLLEGDTDMSLPPGVDDDPPGGGVFPLDAPTTPEGAVLPREIVAPVARAAGCFILILGFESPPDPPNLSFMLLGFSVPVPFAAFFSIFCCSRFATLSIFFAGETIHFVKSLSEWYLIAFSKIMLQSS